MIVKPFEIDKSKVKRIFVFGCSFTNFFWPTWANIVSKEIPQATLYNFGISGLGNLAISCKVSEAHVKFQFNENDLVMILWSTFLREDRWVNGRWFGAGNVYNTGFYDKTFTETYSDVCGYLIRDCSLINMTTTFLDTLPCQSFLMLSVPLDYLEKDYERNDEIYEKVINLYKPLFAKMPKSLFEHVTLDGSWPITHTYEYPEFFGPHSDSHPGPEKYCSYIHENVMRLSQNTFDYAVQANKELLSFTHKSEIAQHFEYDRKDYMLF
jgi:hypothetical protein